MSDFLNAQAPKALAALRIVTALVFIQHGSQKLFDFPAAAFDLHAMLGGLFLPGALLELVGGLLLLVGFLTRPTAFVLSGMMAVAYFTFHLPQGFFPANNYGDAAVLLTFIALHLVFAGPGAWSVDGARANTARLALA